LFLFPLEEEKKEEEEEESNLLLVVVAVVILFFDVATSPVSSTVADVRIDIVRNDDSDARVQTEEVTKDDDDDEAKFRRSFSTSSLRGIRRRILCEDDKSFDAPLKLTDAAFLRIFFDAPVFCTRQALVCADLDDVGQDEDMICFFVLTHKSYGSDLSSFHALAFCFASTVIIIIIIRLCSLCAPQGGRGRSRQQQEEMRMRRGIRFSQFMLLNEELICAGGVS